MILQTNTFLPAIATVAAALIAGGISITNLILAKETKISEFRQAWIDELRSDLAILLTSTRAMSRVIEEFRYSHKTPNITVTSLQFTPEKISEFRHSVASAHYKIKLRLNSVQSDHLELLKLLDTLMTTQNSYINNADASVEDVFAAITKASDHAALVLKEEWRTVKRGEPQYRIAVLSAKIVFIVAAILLIIAVIAIPFLSNKSLLNAEPHSALNLTLPAQTVKSNLPAPKGSETQKLSAP